MCFKLRRFLISGRKNYFWILKMDRKIQDEMDKNLAKSIDKNSLLTLKASNRSIVLSKIFVKSFKTSTT